MPGRRRVEIRSQNRLLDDFFKVDEIFVAHEQYDGTMSKPQRRLNFERGDAVGVLLFNTDTRSVVLVEQFKVPTLIGRRRDDPTTTDGWIVEVMAGMINPGETAEQTAVRETLEETGYTIKDPELICKFLSSPGGTSERIFLYFATVSDSARPGKGGGLKGEDVKVVQISVNDLIERLRNGLIEDPKLAIAAYWLQANIARVESLDHGTVKFRVAGKRDLIVGYKTGDIGYIKDMDIWVNSENSDMMMDRFIGTSVSAKIRWLGANKDDDDNIIDDTIQESLRGMIGDRAHVRIGAVVVTESGMLRATHNVKRIFHVAAVEGGLGTGVKADPAKLKDCVEKVLRRVDRENNTFQRQAAKVFWQWLGKLLGRKFRDSNFDSILFPMMGSGDGRVPVEAVAKEILPAAVRYLRTTPDTTIRQIYFLAYKLRDKSACDKVLGECCEKGELERLEDE